MAAPRQSRIVRENTLDLGSLIPPAWTEQALCRQIDVGDVFFPDKGGSTRDAKATCAACPVRVECLNYALDRDERFGVWDGLSERERRAITRTRRAAS